MDKNIYEILHIDHPFATAAEMQAAMEQGFFQLNKQSSTGGMSIRKDLDLLKKYKTDLVANPALLASWNQELATILRKREADKRAAIETLAEFFGRDGFIAPEALEQVLRTLKKYQTGKDEFLRLSGLKEGVATPKHTFKDDGIVPLDRTPVNIIVDNLETVGKKDLYDVLGKPPTASLQELQQATARLLAEYNDYTNKNYYITAMLKLGGECKNHFSSEEKRKSYEKGMLMRGFEEVRSLILLLRKTSQLVDAHQYAQLLNLALQKGLDRTTALIQIDKYCAEQGLTVVSEVEKEKKGITCRFCRHFNEPQATKCARCGMDLAVKCPQCGQVSMKEEELFCTRCGFSLGDMPQLFGCLERAAAHRQNQELAQAADQLAAAARYWPGHPELLSLEKQLAEDRKIMQSAEQTFDVLAAEKRFATLLERLSGATLAKDRHLHFERLARTALQQARFQLDAATQATDLNKKLRFLAAAAAVCADCPGLETARGEVEIPAPAGLTIKRMARAVRLKWERVPLEGAEYILLKGKGKVPVEITPSTRLTRTGNLSFEDTQLQPGESYYYVLYTTVAVFQSACYAIAGPVLLPADISPDSIRVSTTATSARFEFSIPTQAVAVEIYRDSLLLAQVAGQTYVDEGLSRGRKYTYHFVCQYIDCTGKKVYSDGVGLTVTPVDPPVPVKLSVRETPVGRLVSWSPPARGEVELYYASQPFSVGFNQLVDISALKGRKYPLPPGRRTWEVPMDFKGIRYILAVTAEGDMRIAGDTVSLTHIQAPVELNLVVTGGGEVLLSWPWPDEATRMKIVYRLGEGKPVEQLVNRPDEGRSQLRIWGENQEKISAALYTLATLGRGVEYASNPLEKEIWLQATKVNFVQVRRGGWFRKNKFTLTFETDKKPRASIRLSVALATDYTEPLYEIGEIHPSDFDASGRYEITVERDDWPDGKLRFSAAGFDRSVIVVPPSRIVT